MLKNLHRPKKLVIFTLVKGDAIYHTIPNGKPETHTHTKKKGKNLLRRHRMHLRHNSTTHRVKPRYTP